MNEKKLIRIIKRDERMKNAPGPKGAKAARHSAKQAARDMVENVKSWVTDIQHRRSTETAEALKKLFPDAGRPSEA